MDSYKTIFVICMLFHLVISCTYNQYIYSCNHDDKKLYNIQSTVKAQAIMVSLTCTSIRNISALFTNDWSKLKIISLIQNKHLLCERDVSFQQPHLTIYCYNNISSFCNLQNTGVKIPIMYNNDDHIYAILFFIILPCLVSCCTCISIKTYDLINKKNKKNSKQSTVHWDRTNVNIRHS